MSELIDALNQLQKEKHIEKEVIMQAIEDSLVAAFNDAIKQIERETEKSLGGFSGLPGMGGLF